VIELEVRRNTLEDTYMRLVHDFEGSRK